MSIVEVEQGTDAWLQLRAGKVTASRVADLLSKPRAGSPESAGRRNYRAQIVAEILTGQPQPSNGGFKSQAMIDGTENEKYGRASYEVERSVLVNEVGFIMHPTIERAGCSPDGLVGTDGMIQIKSGFIATHISYLLAGAVPAEYLVQMNFELACTGRMWNDFVSFCPHLPPHLQLFVCRLWRDDGRIAEMNRAVVDFLDEVDGVIKQLNDINASAPNPAPQAPSRAANTEPMETPSEVGITGKAIRAGSGGRERKPAANSAAHEGGIGCHASSVPTGERAVAATTTERMELF